jgi:hypothetical protein
LIVCLKKTTFTMSVTYSGLRASAPEFVPKCDSLIASGYIDDDDYDLELEEFLNSMHAAAMLMNPDIQDIHNMDEYGVQHEIDSEDDLLYEVEFVDDVKADDKAAKLAAMAKKPCRDGAKCKNAKCGFMHPVEAVKVDDKAAKLAAMAKKPCRDGAKCKNAKCGFMHADI